MNGSSQLFVTDSELRATGYDPKNWQNIDRYTRARIASAAIRSRGTPEARDAAKLLDINNPNALSALQLVWQA